MWYEYVMATRDEWAWLAGLFEGEGCILLTAKNSVTLTVKMTDLDVLERAARVAEAGSFMAPVDREGTKRLFTWQVSCSDDAERLLNEMLPWFGERRSSRALAALERLKGCRRPGMCKRGHAIADENLYVSPGGQRQCRACQKIRQTTRVKI